jgi:hypothetical protein
MTTKRTRAAYEGPRFDLADAMAVKHLALGDADTDQQRRALDWIIYGVLGLKESPFDPDSSRNTDYAIGRQDAAREIALYVALPSSDLKTLAERRNPQRRKDAHVS